MLYAVGGQNCLYFQKKNSFIPNFFSLHPWNFSIFSFLREAFVCQTHPKFEIYE